MPPAIAWVKRRADLFVSAIILVAAFQLFWRAPNVQPGDSRYSMLLAENILRHGEASLDRYNLPLKDYQLEQAGGHVYYAFPPGSSLLSVPLVGLLQLRGRSSIAADACLSG